MEKYELKVRNHAFESTCTTFRLCFEEHNLKEQKLNDSPNKKAFTQITALDMLYVFIHYIRN